MWSHNRAQVPRRLRGINETIFSSHFPSLPVARAGVNIGLYIYEISIPF